LTLPVLTAELAWLLGPEVFYPTVRFDPQALAQGNARPGELPPGLDRQPPPLPRFAILDDPSPRNVPITVESSDADSLANDVVALMNRQTWICSDRTSSPIRWGTSRVVCCRWRKVPRPILSGPHGASGTPSGG
jgi:hypothetical protein